MCPLYAKSCKTLMLGKTEDRRRGLKGMRSLDIVTDSMSMNLSKFWEIVEDRGPWSVTMGSQTVEHYLGTEQQHKMYVCVC